MIISNKLFIAGFGFFLFHLIFLTSGISDSKLAIANLECEYVTNPMGIDMKNPRFSWKIISDQRGLFQNAYEVIVGESLSEVVSELGNSWNSGRINSSSSSHIEYQGVPLKSNTKYFWRVRVWADKDSFVNSKPASFHTGLYENSDWKAKWISTEKIIDHESILLRNEFSIDKEIKSAVAYISACGLYEYYLNGEKVGDHVLDPAITDYRKTILYSTFDVTQILKNGVNVAGAMLGNGVYNSKKAEGRYSWGNESISLGNPCFLAQINIIYNDGSQSVISTDESWKFTNGPITFNHFFGGEDYDAQKEIKNWLAPDLEDKNWRNVVLAKNPGGVLKSQLMPPIKVTSTIQPVKQINPSPGVYLFDLGQNIAGWWRIQVKGTKGQTVRIRGAETLNDSLFAKPLEAGDVLSTKFKYHYQTWSDYTLNDNKTEIYEPRFFYSGFRYIEVRTRNNKNLENLSLEGRVVRSSLKRTGTFTSSDSLLNKIYKAGVWSMKANLNSYPTDCPHREKGAYNGDGQVIAETSIHDFQMASYYAKWMNDLRDSQEDNGRIPNTSPTLVGGMGGGVAWGSTYVLIPWWIYHYYNDVSMLEDHYPNMKMYIQYLKELGTKDENPEEPYIINNFDGYWYSLGEWCAPGQKDGPNHAVVNTFYYYYNSLLMSKIAKLLEKSDDAQYFSDLSDTIKIEFNNKFFNAQTGLYGTEETYQSYQLLTLVGDLVPEGHRAQVLKTIVDDIENRNGHLNTGIIGTKYLWPVLVEGGYDDLAFKVATRTTFPSYGYWLNNGSTTLLEEWSGENSHNHQMFGSVIAYFYKFLAGIQSPLEGKTTLGYQHIHLEPKIPEKLTSVTASLQTVSGEIVSDWQKEKDVFNYKVSIPPNTTATVVIPLFEFKKAILTEGNSRIWNDEEYIKGVSGIVDVNKETNTLMVSIVSGDYNFRLSTHE